MYYGDVERINLAQDRFNSCAHVNEHWCSTKLTECTDWLCNCQLIKKDRKPCCSCISKV